MNVSFHYLCVYLLCVMSLTFNNTTKKSRAKHLLNIGVGTYLQCLISVIQNFIKVFYLDVGG